MKVPNSLHKVGIDIVSGCNLRCLGCPISTLKPHVQIMPRENFVKIINNIDVKTIDCLRLFNFGEPMLHPDLGMLRELVNAPFGGYLPRVELSTNGQIVDEGKMSIIMYSEIVTHFIVSCDGDGTPEDYERLRPPAKWDKLMRTLEIAQRYRTSFTKLMTRTICMTKEGRNRWIDVLKPFGFNPEFRDWNVMADAENLSNRTIVVPKQVCRYLDSELPKLYVMADGTVTPCCMHPKPFVMGNLLNNKFSEIYAGKERHGYIKQMRKNRMAIAVCNECEAH